MPLVAHNDLPTFARLRSRGHEVLTLQRAKEQDIRELHIGFLNMMSDAALTNAGLDAPHSRYNAVTRSQLEEAGLPEFPEDELAGYVDNTWTDTGKAIVNNWLGLVYKLTNLQRNLQFMPGVDPNNPVQLKITPPHS